MKKIIVQIAMAALLFTNISCSSEKDEVIEEVVKETPSKIITELPQNAVSAEEFLKSKGIDVKSSKEKTTNQTSSNNRGSLDEGTGTYIMFFVVYPVDWNYTKRLNYLNNVRSNTNRDIYVELNICEYIDTWYVEVLSSDVFMKNKSKNVIEASATNTDIETTVSSEDDGPGAQESTSGINIDEYYYHCTDILLPDEYSDSILQEGPSSGGPTGGGPNSDPTLPQE